jgi:hypothetical protein
MDVFDGWNDASSSTYQFFLPTDYYEGSRAGPFSARKLICEIEFKV